jgi:uncharacterized UPF0160 family protein
MEKNLHQQKDTVEGEVNLIKNKFRSIINDLTPLLDDEECSRDDVLHKVERVTDNLEEVRVLEQKRISEATNRELEDLKKMGLELPDDCPIKSNVIRITMNVRATLNLINKIRQ